VFTSYHQYNIILTYAILGMYNLIKLYLLLLLHTQGPKAVACGKPFMYICSSALDQKMIKTLLGPTHVDIEVLTSTWKKYQITSMLVLNDMMFDHSSGEGQH
jgi:hypothetical protein